MMRTVSSRANRLYSMWRIAAMVFAVCAGLSCASMGSVTEVDSFTCEVTYPTANSTVSMNDYASGTCSPIPESYTLWTVVYPYPARRYYPQEAVRRQQTGEWKSYVGFGVEESKGVLFDLVMVLADENANKKFKFFNEECEKKKSWPGMEKLPEDIKILSEITVKRK